MSETGELLRYALKLATGTGKTVVMALFVTWATLHKQKVSGSSLSENFFVLVPNLTVCDRVKGTTRGDGLDPADEHNLYDAFDTVPPEYHEEFRPNVVVRNWQGISLEGKRDDWIGEDDMPLEEGRFIPQAVLRAMQRRARQDPKCTNPTTARPLARSCGHQRRGAPRLWRETWAKGRGRGIYQVEQNPGADFKGRAGEPRAGSVGDALVRLWFA
jgi:hypothetical protein